MPNIAELLAPFFQGAIQIPFDLVKTKALLGKDIVVLYRRGKVENLVRSVYCGIARIADPRKYKSERRLTAIRVSMTDGKRSLINFIKIETKEDTHKIRGRKFDYICFIEKYPTNR